jgi:hypothetical protein
MVEGRIAEGDSTVLAHALIGVTRHLARTYLYERAADVPVAQVADTAVSFSLLGLLGGA